MDPTPEPRPAEAEPGLVAQEGTALAVRANLDRATGQGQRRHGGERQPSQDDRVESLR
jgi:hypothetical protein